MGTNEDNTIKLVDSFSHHAMEALAWLGMLGEEKRNDSASFQFLVQLSGESLVRVPIANERGLHDRNQPLQIYIAMVFGAPPHRGIRCREPCAAISWRQRGEAGTTSAHSRSAVAYLSW